MVYKSFNKKTSGGGITNENNENMQMKTNYWKI